MARKTHGGAYLGSAGQSLSLEACQGAWGASGGVPGIFEAGAAGVGGGAYTVVDTVPEIEVLASAVRHHIVPSLGLGDDLVVALSARVQLRLGLYAVVAARLLDLRPASISSQDPKLCFPSRPPVQSLMGSRSAGGEGAGPAS